MSELILFYDTETTGFPDWHQPSDAEHQPHIVQLAACLVERETRKIVSSMDVVVSADGWEIPEEVSKIHGITTERAKAVGVSEESALILFLELWDDISLDRERVAHNEGFDARIIRIATKRYLGEKAADEWKAGPAKCTARMSTSLVGLPPTEKMLAAGRNTPKTPNLGEAYEYFTRKNIENAHTAMADVRACMEIYWHILDIKRAA